MAKQFLSCIGCVFDDPDYGCMRKHNWECPQEEYDFEEVPGNE